MQNAVTQQHGSIIESIKKFDIKGVIQHIKDQPINWLEVGTFLAAGVLAGFLFRRYFRGLVVWSLIALATVIVFDYVGFVDIKWETVQGILGTSPAASIDMYLQHGLVWIKSNVPLVISLIIGFTIGVKVG